MTVSIVVAGGATGEDEEAAIADTGEIVVELGIESIFSLAEIINSILVDAALWSAKWVHCSCAIRAEAAINTRHPEVTNQHGRSKVENQVLPLRLLLEFVT